MIRNSSRLINHFSTTINSITHGPILGALQMPERGIGWFNPIRLENYLANLNNLNKKSQKKGAIESLHSHSLDTGPFIHIHAISLERAGNLLNSSRKTYDKKELISASSPTSKELISSTTINIRSQTNFYSYFAVNNRRAIIGYKLLISFTN